MSIIPTILLLIVLSIFYTSEAFGGCGVSYAVFIGVFWIVIPAFIGASSESFDEELFGIKGVHNWILITAVILFFYYLMTDGLC